MCSDLRCRRFPAAPRYANCPGCAGYAPTRGGDYCIIRRCDLRGHSAAECARREAEQPMESAGDGAT